MNKYRNRKMVVDGETFDSKGEFERYGQLRLLERARMIQALSRQPRYPIRVNGHDICEYVADFAYHEGGRQIAEDFKGVLTAQFRLKRKLFQALYPHIELRVTNRKGAVVNVRTRKLAARKSSPTRSAAEAA